MNWENWLIVVAVVAVVAVVVENWGEKMGVIINAASVFDVCK